MNLRSGIFRAAFVAIAFGLSGCGTGAEAPTEAVVRKYVAAEGKVETLTGGQVNVGSEIVGRIEKIYVNEGDSVKAGDVLATLASLDAEARLREAEKDLAVAKARLVEVESGSRAEEVKRAEAQLESAEAELTLAGKNLARYGELHARGVASKNQADEAVSAHKVASGRVKALREEKALLVRGAKAETLKFHRAGVERAAAAVVSAKALFDKTVIRAPISGKVIKRLMAEGETIIPEYPMITVADVERVRVNAEVDETDIGRIGLDDAAEVRSDAFPGTVFHGKIEEIADYVGERQVRPNDTKKNADMKVVQVKIALREKTPLKLGMTVDVRITPSVKAGAMPPKAGSAGHGKAPGKAGNGSSAL